MIPICRPCYIIVLYIPTPHYHADAKYKKKKQKNKDRSVYDDVDANLKKRKKKPQKGGEEGERFHKKYCLQKQSQGKKPKKKVSLCFQMPVPCPPALPSFAKNLCPHHFFFAFLFYFIIYKPESIDATTVVFV